MLRFLRDWRMTLSIFALQWAIIIYGIIYLTYEHCMTLGGCSK